MFIICSAPLHPHMQGSALPCKEAVRAHDPETLLVLSLKGVHGIGSLHIWKEAISANLFFISLLKTKPFVVFNLSLHFFSISTFNQLK